MQNQNAPTALRRSSRVPAAVSILVTSLDGTHFSEVCQTVVVNAHGCAMLSRVKLDPGIPLHFHSKDGRETTAHVVSCQPIGLDNRGWRLGATLDRPENFWGLRECPQDWAVPLAPTSRTLLQPRPPSTTLPVRKLPLEGNQPSDALLDRVARQWEAQVAKMIAESIRPIQAEVTELREKMARREVNPSRFEVSLSSIPPELEQQLQLRLRQDLGPRVIDDARRQYATLITAAKNEIDQKTTQTHEDFLRRVAQELQVVEQQAQELSRHVSENALEHLRRGLEDFHQKLMDGGNSLKRLSEELLDYLQHNLNDECNARHGELEQLGARVASESSRLHEHIEYIDVRIRKLEEAAHGLETGLDQRLSLMSSNIAKDVRSQLESMATDVLEEFATRGNKALEDQLDQTSANMSTVQKEIVASASESLKVEAANALHAFEHSMDELAKLSVERWRRRLADGLSALVKSVDEQFPLGTKSSDHEGEE
jgi:hypothetical protein